MTTTQPLKVGDRFTKRDRRNYTENGEKRTHRLELLCEVVRTHEVGFEWRTVDVMHEEGRPTSFAAFVAGKGQTAWFGWEAARSRGDVALVF